MKLVSPILNRVSVASSSRLAKCGSRFSEVDIPILNNFQGHVQIHVIVPEVNHFPVKFHLQIVIENHMVINFMTIIRPGMPFSTYYSKKKNIQMKISQTLKLVITKVLIAVYFLRHVLERFDLRHINMAYVVFSGGLKSILTSRACNMENATQKKEILFTCRTSFKLKCIPTSLLCTKTITVTFYI